MTVCTGRRRHQAGRGFSATPPEPLDVDQLSQGADDRVDDLSEADRLEGLPSDAIRGRHGESRHPAPGPWLARGRHRGVDEAGLVGRCHRDADAGDRKSTRLNSSHITNSYAVFRLKKKTQ